MLNLSYANLNSDPSSNSIGWINWENLTLDPGTNINNMKVNLPNNSVMTFDLINVPISNGGFTIYSSEIPTSENSPFGTIGFTDISGNVALELFNDYVTLNTSSEFIIDNINVKDAFGNNLYDYNFIISSIETGNDDYQEYISNGSEWLLLTRLGNFTSPKIQGQRTRALELYGVSSNSDSVIAVTKSTKTISIIITSNTGLSSFAIGFASGSSKLIENLNIVKGSLLKFNIGFTIPVNSLYNKISILDSLTPGFKYNSLNNPLYISINNTIIDSPNIINNSTENEIDLVFNKELSQSDIPLNVLISIPISVYDLDLLYESISSSINLGYPLENNAYITTFDFNDEIICQITSKALLDFNLLNSNSIFASGLGINSKKVGNIETSLVCNIPAAYSLESNRLTYRLTILANNNLNISNISEDKIFVNFGSNSFKLSDINGYLYKSIGDNPQKFSIEFTQLSNMKDNAIFVSALVLTDPNITILNENVLTSIALVELIYTPESTNIPEVVSTSSEFSIKINLIPEPPQIIVP